MTLTLDLPDGLAERLEQAAAQHGVPLADYVRPALEALATPGPGAPRRDRGIDRQAGCGRRDRRGINPTATRRKSVQTD